MNPRPDVVARMPSAGLVGRSLPDRITILARTALAMGDLLGDQVWLEWVCVDGELRLVRHLASSEEQPPSPTLGPPVTRVPEEPDGQAPPP